MRNPRILILGYARHGKDTVAEILRDQHGLSFRSSSHFLAEVCVRPYLAALGITYDSLEECYEDRVNHRHHWHDAIAEYNREDPALLAREILKVADIYVGMRSYREYSVARDLFDAVWWVDASGRGLLPESKASMDISFEPGRMMLVDNSGPLEYLNRGVASALGLTRRMIVEAA